MAHPGRIAAARATNKKLAAKKDRNRRASAARTFKRDSETGRKVGRNHTKSSLESRHDGRVSLTFTLFAGFGGTALGAEAIGCVCGGVFDSDEKAMRVLEGNLAPPKVTSEGATLERAFMRFDGLKS